MRTADFFRDRTSQLGWVRRRIAATREHLATGSHDARAAVLLPLQLGCLRERMCILLAALQGRRTR
jgi:hypothetical protein